MLKDWVLARLEAAKTCPNIVLRDPLHLLLDADATLHDFAQENGFTVIVAATNLVFRELYELIKVDPEVKKILVFDRAPQRRRVNRSLAKAPPPFYPDLLAKTPQEARIDLDLRQYLILETGDPNWPLEANDQNYARLIVNHLEDVLRAHQNLRAANEGRFNDYDLKVIVAFAALGIADAAFKTLSAEQYWKIGLLGHDALQELEELAPEVTKPIRAELQKAPAPFCWFSDQDPELVLRAFYLAVILAQHAPQWELLLMRADPSLAQVTAMKRETLDDAACKLVALNPDQASRDLENVEKGLSREALQLILVEHLHITEAPGFTALIQQENYSNLFRSLALLVALRDLVSSKSSAASAQATHQTLSRLLANASIKDVFIERRTSHTWEQLKEAYHLAEQIQSLRQELERGIRNLRVGGEDRRTFTAFWDIWNSKRINRMDYYVSALERIIDSGELLPRSAENLPADFGGAFAEIRQNVRTISLEVSQQLDALNRLFQDVVAAQYPQWVAEEIKAGQGAKYEPAQGTSLPLFPTSPVLTSQFLRRCLKPHWDSQHEKAVIFIFDGMRYDIWDELLLPLVHDYLEVMADLPASSLLPSETQITRKAICAGTTPDNFDQHSGEDSLLQEALTKEFGRSFQVEVMNPEGAGTGETVRYHTENLDVFIFELCDKELHKISWRTLPDGREVPSRPLAFIYEQHLRNILATEVMSIIRNLAAGTKVFITADHGFGRVGREPLWFEDHDLYDPMDCHYQYCSLRVPFSEADMPPKVRSNVIAFTLQQLRMPHEEQRVSFKTRQILAKEFKAIVFPKVGFSFSRQGAPYKPDAYSHGGISLQELIIPMVVLRVKGREETLALEAVIGPEEALENEDIVFRLPMRRGKLKDSGTDELRVEVRAQVTRSEPPDDEWSMGLPNQVYYVGASGAEAVYRFRINPEVATVEERRREEMPCALTLTVSYQEGGRRVSKSQRQLFRVRLNSERIVRRVGSLGNILGLMPRKQE